MSLGRKNKDITDAITKVFVAYNCKIVERIFKHQLKLLVIEEEEELFRCLG